MRILQGTTKLVDDDEQEEEDEEDDEDAKQPAQWDNQSCPEEPPILLGRSCNFFDDNQPPKFGFIDQHYSVISMISMISMMKCHQHDQHDQHDDDQGDHLQTAALCSLQDECFQEPSVESMKTQEAPSPACLLVNIKFNNKDIIINHHHH